MREPEASGKLAGKIIPSLRDSRVWAFKNLRVL